MHSGLHKFSKMIFFDSYVELDCSRKKASLPQSHAMILEFQFLFQLFSSLGEKSLKL